VKGWSRHPVAAYDRADLWAPQRRIKEWDYYCILGEQFGVAFMVADFGYVGILSASVLDILGREHTSETYLVPFPLGRFGMPKSSSSGEVKVRHKKGVFDFARLESGARILKVDLPQFGRGVGLRGALVLLEVPQSESMVTVSSWRRHKRAVAYSQKINCLSAEGVIQFGDHELMFAKNSASGVLNWSRGAWPRHINWYWASASGTLEGKAFGFNLGYGYGDPRWGSENAILFDGVVHKLSSIVFRINPRDLMAPWRFESGDGRFEATLDTSFDLASSQRVLFYSSLRHQVFGYFSGKAILDDGTELRFERMPGFAEKAKNRW